MGYELFNTGASIRFVSDDGFFFLMKHHIKSIRYVRDNMIRIDTGCCMHSLYLQAHQVVYPGHDGAENLAMILNGWITGFLQHPPAPDPGQVE